MTTPGDVLVAEDTFFQALLRGDGASLQGVLMPDFLLIDVLSGSEISVMVTDSLTLVVRK